MNTKLPEAVCILIPSPEGILSISRRNDPTKCGLPGGKVDPGETEIEAVIRETFEETGLKVYYAELAHLYADICEGDVTFIVTTFLYYGQAPDLESLTPEDGMILEYKPFSTLLREESSPFAKYNLGVLDAYLKALHTAHACLYQLSK